MERYSKNTQTKSNHKLGNGLLIVIIITALAGLLYSFAGTDSHANDYEGTVLPMKINQKPGDNQEEDGNKLAKNIKLQNTKYLNIEGIKEADMPIRFQIFPYHKDVNYFLDFGNGVTQKIEGDTTVYTFTETGTYEIKLKVEYKGSLRTIQQELLSINPAFELAGH